MSLSTSPILAAAASNDVAATRWLIEHERVHVDELGDWFGCPDVATSGSAKHAKSASLKRKRRTPLMVAATHGSVDALSYLLRAGADPNCRSDDDEKATALHCAASGGSSAPVRRRRPRSGRVRARARGRAASKRATRRVYERYYERV